MKANKSTVKGKMKTLFLTSLAMLSLASGNVWASSSGGVGDGGGNVIAEDMMGPYEIRDLLAKSKVPAKYVLRNIETIGRNDTSSAEMGRIYQKLFGGSQTVYQALDQAVFEPIQTGGCDGIGGMEHDASALKNAPRICFSLEALSAKLDEKSGRAQLLALVIHEVSHLVGTTEDEAQELQKSVQANVSTKLFDRISDIVEANKRDIKDIIEAGHSARQAIAANQKGLFCQITPLMVSLVSNFQNRSSDYFGDPGISVLDPKGFSNFSSGFLKALNLLSLCGKDSPRVGIEAAFKGKNQTSLADYYQVFWQYAPPAGSLPNDKVRKLNPNRLKGAAVEVDEMLNYFEKVAEGI